MRSHRTKRIAIEKVITDHDGFVMYGRPLPIPAQPKPQPPPPKPIEVSNECRSRSGQISFNNGLVARPVYAGGVATGEWMVRGFGPKDDWVVVPDRDAALFWCRDAEVECQKSRSRVQEEPFFG